MVLITIGSQMWRWIAALTAPMPPRGGSAASMVSPAPSQRYSTERQLSAAHILTMTHIYDMGWGPVEINHAPLV